MNVQERVYNHLSLHAGIAALVGTRIYRRMLPQRATLPALTYFRVSTRPEYSHDGDDKPHDVRMQISCWASTDSGADALATQVQAAMNSWKAAYAQPALMDNDVDVTEPETGVYQRVQDWMIRDGG